MAEQRAPANLAAVDALYRPFPELAGWARLGPIQRDLWARFAAELDERKRLATADQLERAVMVAVRAAAIDTGAIDGAGAPAACATRFGVVLSHCGMKAPWRHQFRT